MATLPVKNTGDDTTHNSWATAYPTTAAAVTAYSAGDIIVVSNNSAETGATSITKASPSSPVPIIGVNDSAYPPTALATGASISAATSLNWSGDLHVTGIKSIWGTSSSANCTVGQAAHGTVYMENCRFEPAAAGSSNAFQVGPNTATAVAGNADFRSCVWKFSNVNQVMKLGHSNTAWRDCTIPDGAGSIPTTLFSLAVLDAQGAGGRHEFIGCDFSAQTGKLFGGTGTAPVLLILDNCKLNAGVGNLIDTQTGPGSATLILKNSGSANNNYQYKLMCYQGTIDVDTSQYITADADGKTSDGTTAYSWKMASSASASYYQPLYSEWIDVRNATTGSAINVRFEGLIDAAAKPNNDEAWIEIVACTDASSSISTSADDKCALVAHTALSGSAAAQANSALAAGAWTKGAAGVGWLTFKLDASITPQKAQYVRARVALGGASKTIYINPKPLVS